MSPFLHHTIFALPVFHIATFWSRLREIAPTPVGNASAHSHIMVSIVLAMIASVSESGLDAVPRSDSDRESLAHKYMAKSVAVFQQGGLRMIETNEKHSLDSIRALLLHHAFYRTRHPQTASS